MGCLVHAGILKEDKTLTDLAKNNFIREVKEILVYGSNTPTPPIFQCGDPIPPPNPPLRMEDFPLEDETLYESFHRDVIKNQYEKTAASLDVESTFSLLPVLADPMALATSFGVKLPPVPFPGGFVPYLTGLLVPKFFVDLLDAGVTDFLMPPALIPELVKLVAPPAPPVIPPLPPIELPPLLSPDAIPPPAIPPVSLAAEILTLPGAPVPELPAPPELPPVPIPAPPPVALADVYLKDVALLEGIPKVIGEVIAEIPKLVSKIANPVEIISFVCGKVKESGMLGTSSPENDLERAVSTVLSRKIAECIFFVSIAKTLGSGYGGLNASVAKGTLKYDPPPSEPPTKVEQESPAEIVAKYALGLSTVNANGSYGNSYGGNPSGYIDVLLYAESGNSQMPPGSINVYGEPVAEPDPTTVPPKLTKKLIKDSPDLQARLPLWSNQGFYTLADWSARDYSSCAMFGRSCYFRAGAQNRYFQSLYHNGTALAGIRYLGMLKNYRWIFKDDAGNFKNVNEDLIQAAPQIGATQDGKANEITSTQWYINADGTPNNEKLRPWVKPLEERAYLDPLQLGGMAKLGKFPGVRRGDMILLAVMGANGGESNHHMSVVTTDYLYEDAFPKETLGKLNKIMLTVDGGQSDDLNLAPPSSSGLATVITEEKLLEGATKKEGGNWILSSYLLGNTFVERGKDDSRKLYRVNKREPPASKPAGSTSNQWNDNYLLEDVTGLRMFPKPSAIIPSKYDLGYMDTDGEYPGFYLARSVLFSTQKGASSGNEGSTNTPGEVRKIVGIFRTNNYLDRVENSNVDDPDVASEIYRTIQAQDEHPLFTNSTEGNMYKLSKFNIDQLIDLCFPGMPSK